MKENSLSAQESFLGIAQGKEYLGKENAQESVENAQESFLGLLVSSIALKVR